MIITIADLEDAINACRTAEPPVGYVLPPDLRLMASVYGAAIHQKADMIDLGQHTQARANAVMRWLAVPACPLRQGGMDEPCEACQ